VKNLFIGTSGYNYKEWKGIFYPESLPKTKWLSFYSQNFNSIEINATFYGRFTKKTFEKWKDQTPRDFLFALKGSRYITHVKRIKNHELGIMDFFKNVKGLGEKLGVVLWQFPNNFKLKDENIKRLEAFIESLPVNIRQAFEFRDESWFVDNVFELLNKYNAGIAMNDSSVFPKMEKITGDFCYIRFHGPSNLYSSSYSDEELKIWAEKIKKYSKKYDIYCYFNNDVNGYAIENAKRLKELLKK